MPDLVSVLDFGATRDDSTDDSAAIQDAIRRVPEGGTLFFPQGIYVIGSPLVVDRSHLTMQGEGPSSVLRLMSGINRDLIVMPSLQGTPLPEETPQITDIT